MRSFTPSKCISVNRLSPVFKSTMPMRSNFFCVELNTIIPSEITKLRMLPLRVYSLSVILVFLVLVSKANTKKVPSLSRRIA